MVVAVLEALLNPAIHLSDECSEPPFDDGFWCAHCNIMHYWGIFPSVSRQYPWRSRAQLPISLRVWKRQQQNHWSIDVYWSVVWCWRCTGAWKQIHWPQILAKTWLNLVELRNHGMHSRHSLPGHGPSNSLPLRVGCLKDGFGSKVLPQETHIKTYKNHTAANEFRGWIRSRKGAWTSKGAHWKKPENEFC